MGKYHPGISRDLLSYSKYGHICKKIGKFARLDIHQWYIRGILGPKLSNKYRLRGLYLYVDLRRIVLTWQLCLLTKNYQIYKNNPLRPSSHLTVRKSVTHISLRNGARGQEGWRRIFADKCRGANLSEPSTTTARNVWSSLLLLIPYLRGSSLTSGRMSPKPMVVTVDPRK